MTDLHAELAGRQGRIVPLVAEPAGDPVAVAAVAERAAVAWRLAEPELLRMAMNGVFACGDEVVLRVGRSSGDPRTVLHLAERARAAGVATPGPLRGDAFNGGDGLWVTAWERIHPVSAATDWEAVGAMVAALHALPAPPDAAALPWCGDFPWWRFEDFAPPVLASIDTDAAAGLRAALAAHGDWDAVVRGGPLVVCHGDVHPGNVLMTETGPVLLDWDLACIGPAAWDHCALMTWSSRWGGEPGIYEAFAAGYGRSLVGDPIAASLATLRLVAATLLRVRAGAADPAAAAEASERLRFWRGDLDAPQWNPQ